MKILAHRIEVAPDAAPTRTAFLLHGILGSLRNWRSFARTLVRRFPDWRIVLVDLRNHGESHGQDAPHDLVACAADLHRLAGHLNLSKVTVLGHSFGGKVGMRFAERYADQIDELWVFDSHPGPRPTGEAAKQNEVVRVMDALRAISVPLASRPEVVEQLVSQGFSEMIARWMTTNLRRTPEGFVWRFDLQKAKEMLYDYAIQDMIPVLETIDIPMHFVWGERSEQRRFGTINPSGNSNIHEYTLENSGHWVHADNPEGLMSLLESKFSRS